MVFTLPTLDYAYDALAPHIDAKTMEIHHTKHHQTYVDKLNTALVGSGEWEEKSLWELLQSLDVLPDTIRGAVRNHGGGHWNHSFFWKTLTPGGKEMTPEFEKLVVASFGSFDEMKKQFTDKALAVFWSGWTRLVKDHDDLIIMSTPNQDNPSMTSYKPIFGIDLWEHAYYLNYQNRRADYVAAVWEVIDWEQVEKFCTRPLFL
jgi:superoxide dismutase, Fe-Mn family